MADNPPNRVAGSGPITCGEFEQQQIGIPELEAKMSDIVQLAFYNWAEGYMSGIQVSLSESERVDLNPEKFGMTEQKDFIWRFCASNPHLTYEDGVRHLYNEIRRINHREPILSETP